jgi:hypothetical protein
MVKGHQSFSILFWLNRHRSKNNKPAIYLRLIIIKNGLNFQHTVILNHIYGTSRGNA